MDPITIDYIKKNILFLAIFFIGEWVIYLIRLMIIRKYNQKGNLIKLEKDKIRGLPKWLSMNSFERLLVALFLILGYESILLVYGVLKIASRLQPAQREEQPNADNFFLDNFLSLFVALIYKKFFFWLLSDFVYTHWFWS